MVQETKLPVGQAQVHDGHAQVIGEGFSEEGKFQRFSLQQIDLQVAQVQGLVDQTDLQGMIC